MAYDLPTTVTIGSKEYNIRNKGDFRVMLDLIAALNDLNLNEKEKAICVLRIFYEDCSDIEDVETALKEAMKFLNLGEEESNTNIKKPILMDWEQDFRLIVSPINRVLNTEVRLLEYLHWWTFIGAYYEIGDCLFAQVISIRNKQKKGKKLEKYEREFLNENRDIIKLKTATTDEEQALIDSILNS